MTRTTSFITRCRSALRSRGEWTRREFLRGAAGVVALRHMPSGVPAPQFAYVASGEGVLHVFSVRGDAVDAYTARPEPRACQCLDLAGATDTLRGQRGRGARRTAAGNGGGISRRSSGRPTHVVEPSTTFAIRDPAAAHGLVPGWELLAVAAYGGGIYNLFSIAKDGSLSPPSHIFKDVGCAAIPMRCSSMPARRHLLSSDFANDRLSVFAVDEDRLRRCMQRSTGSGSGPGASVLHPSGSFFYTWHDLESTLVCYRYDGGTVGEAIQRFRCSAGGLAMHPSGRALYTGQGVWQIDVESGRLVRTQDVLPGSGQIAVTPGGESVYVLARTGGYIYQVAADRMTGRLLSKTEVAAVNEPRSIAVKTI